MDVPEGNIHATKITAEDLDIEIGGDPEPPQQQVSTGCLLGPEKTPKLKIYNQSTLPQKIQYWLVVALSIGSLISYVTTVISSFGLKATQCNFTASSTALPK